MTVDDIINIGLFLILASILPIFFIAFPDEIRKFSEKHPHAFRGGTLKNKSDSTIRILGVFQIIILIIIGVLIFRSDIQ